MKAASGHPAGRSDGPDLAALTREVMAIPLGMAIPRIKATYSFDVETVRLLERMSLRWGVSKSEALRRAVQASASLAEPPDAQDSRLAALDGLQKSVALDIRAARVWEKNVRAERRATPASDRPG